MLYVARNKNIGSGREEEERVVERRTSKTNEDFEGGVKQMRAGTEGMLGKQAGEADTGMDPLKSTERL